jgi:hypothetical protein
VPTRHAPAQAYGGNHGKLPAAWVLVGPAPWESRFPGKRLLPVVDDTHSVPGTKEPGACRRVRREITVQEGDECISHFQDAIYFYPEAEHDQRGFDRAVRQAEERLKEIDG